MTRKAAEASLPPTQAAAMDKFRTLFQHFQSSSESVMNGICLLLAMVTVKLYSSFDFNCPCLARYNALYGLGLLFTPPIALFLCGLLANRQSVVMVEEWRRPAGHRRKDPGIVRCGPTPLQLPVGIVRGSPNCISTARGSSNPSDPMGMVRAPPGTPKGTAYREESLPLKSLVWKRMLHLVGCYLIGNTGKMGSSGWVLLSFWLFRKERGPLR